MSVKINVKFERKDMGMARALRDIEDLNDGHVLVGLPGDDSPRAKNEDGSPSPFTVAQLGVIHEFGVESQNIPARPFMDQTRRVNWDKTKRKVKIITRNVIMGKMSPEKGFALLGNWYEGRIKYQIRNGDYVPNAPATIAAKGSSRPLIDTGLMRASVTHIVKMGGFV